MKNLIKRNLFNNIYKNKKVFITGQTGFKGSWLALWLVNMGAKVYGYSVDIPTKPNHYELLKLDISNTKGDIRDIESLKLAIKKCDPDIIFHMAAQTIVRESYKEPANTFSANVIGTVNLLESARSCKNLKAIVHISTDKCYDNKEWIWGYRENDPLGGYDPYSASKACAELAVFSYRNSFFNNNDYGKKHNVLIASARAGNVIGGGDWAKDRLIPDIIRNIENGKNIIIRNPNSTRPWQFVLEPLSGYLLLGQKLLEGKKEFAESWNFGPESSRSIKVSELLEFSKKHWNTIKYKLDYTKHELHEASMLHLDCSKAFNLLNWKPVYDHNIMIKKTILWYKNFYENNKVISHQDLDEYIKTAVKENIVWTIL